MLFNKIARGTIGRGVRPKRAIKPCVSETRNEDAGEASAPYQGENAKMKAAGARTRRVNERGFGPGWIGPPPDSEQMES